MVPLRITFTFCTPVVIENEHPIHLDGLLASCVAQEAEAFGSENAWADADDLSHLLERTDEDSNGQWVWKASKLVFEPASQKHFQNIVRRIEPEAFMQAQDSGLVASRRAYLSTGSGHEKAYFLHHTYQWMRSATAWCIGDPVEIEQALQRIQSIGPMSRNGFGAVNSIEVVVTDQATRWMNRFMPAAHALSDEFSYIPALRRLHAPYWKKESITEVMLPV